MRTFWIPLTALALTACQQPSPANNEAAEDAALANEITAPQPPSPLDQIAGTSWQWTEKSVGTAVSSFDADGHYRVMQGAKMIEHGLWAVADGKMCETRDGSTKGPICWTMTEMPAIGGTTKVTSDDGQSLDVTHVAYAPPAGGTPG